jgi:hypothetical protein
VNASGTPPDTGIDDAQRDWLVRYALGELDMPERARLQQQAAANPALVGEAMALQRSFELLGMANAAPPPPQLRARTLQAARAALRNADRNGSADREPAPDAAVSLTGFAARKKERARKYASWAAAVLATAASIACVVLAVDRQQLRSELQLQAHAASMLLEPNVVQSFAFQCSGSAQGAQGVVLLDLDARRASIAVRKLPPLPTGQAYHLWAVLEDKQVPCGRFARAADGSIVTQFAIPVDSYSSPIQKLILTVEPDSEQAVPHGSTVMSS